ncbi:MAG TPA: EAL domain-containing protein [Gemmatimonadaceae bacterium]|jgi:EAL domain-containing protein (putative c-di-GMP-specific phosphodiesterase class I)/ActR/RegA family two-component response regulator
MGDVAGLEGSAILLVDDDDRILSMLARALAAPGIELRVANSGAGALAELALRGFDVLVCDIQMPEMSGIKLLHAVREHDLDLPVVLITGHPDLKTAAAAVQYGAFQYLIKPLEIGRFRAVIDRAVNVGRMARLKRECVQESGSGSFYVGDHAGIQSTLDRALQSVWIAYQPVVQANDGRTFGYEALLRSAEPILQHPSALLKAAERVRRVHDVGRAVRDLVALGAERIARSSCVFVNLHPEDLMDPALYLPNAPLTRVAARVVLELTDRASFEQVSDVQERIARLRALGFRFAIDDLGAEPGESNTFQELDSEFVKLDISVVRGVDHDPAKKKMVRSMINVCHRLRKTVIAEGVESADQRDVLLDAGCDLLQGYYFGRPAALEASLLTVGSEA